MERFFSSFGNLIHKAGRGSTAHHALSTREYPMNTSGSAVQNAFKSAKKRKIWA